MSSKEGPAAPCAPYGVADSDCRLVLDQITDKWSILILATLCKGPLRFNEIRRQLETVTQKALTLSLRKLERNGLVTRTVHIGPPVAVVYAVTPLGKTLRDPINALWQWTQDYLPQVREAQSEFDARRTEQAA